MKFVATKTAEQLDLQALHRVRERLVSQRQNQVAALLRDYDIRSVVVHPTKRADFSRHGYRAAHFEDAFARFLPHEPNIRTLKRGREGM